MILFNKTYLALNVLQASQDTPIDSDDSEKFPEVNEAWIKILKLMVFMLVVPSIPIAKDSLMS